MRGTITNGALALGLALTVAACGEPATEAGGNGMANEATANETAPDAGVKNMGSADTTPETDLAGARRLIDTIYAPYTRGETADPTGSLSPELLAALNRDDEAELGADPFCECQDFEQFSYSIQSLEPTANGAVARVATSNFGQSRIIVVHLVQSGGSWKVADVGEGPNSMMQTLSR